MDTTTATEVKSNTGNDPTNTSNDTIEEDASKVKGASPEQTPQTQQPVVVNHVSVGQDFDTLLRKAIAIQLKAMNSDTTMALTAFNELFMLVSSQLDDSLNELHGLALLQRRTTLAKGDILLLLRGFNLKTSDLYETLQSSNYIRKKFHQECDALNEEARQWVEPYTLRQHEDVIDNPFTAVEQSQELSSLLARQPLVLLRGSTLASFRHRKPFRVPAWLPRLPPDHTYRFTPQYNHPTTDEIVVRKRVVEEGRNTEKALRNLIDAINNNKNNKGTKGKDNEDTMDYKEPREMNDLELAERESQALFSEGGWTHSTASASATEQDTSISSITAIPKTFNVEDYARRRVEIARRQVTRFEEEKLRQHNDPFIRLAQMMLNSDGAAPRVEFNGKVLAVARRSYRYMLHNLPALKRRKIEAVKQAELDRDFKLKQLKELKEKMEKDSIKISLKRELEMEATLLEKENKNKTSEGEEKGNGDQQVETQKEEKLVTVETANSPNTVLRDGQDGIVTLSNNASETVETLAPTSNPSQAENSAENPSLKAEGPIKGELGDTLPSGQEEVAANEGTKEKAGENYSERKVEEEEREKGDDVYTDTAVGVQEQATKPDREPGQGQEQELEQAGEQFAEKKRASTFSDEEEEEAVEAANALFDDIMDPQDVDT